VRRAATRGLLLALLVPAAVALPAGAALARGLPPQIRQLAGRGGAGTGGGASVNPQFSTKNADGYEFSVSGTGNTQAVYLEVTRNHGKSATYYVARGTVSGGRLQASFGKFGEVAMRFRPSANRTWVRPHRTCRHVGRYVKRTGIFVGEFHFHGEHGYTSVETKRTSGEVVTVASKCRHKRSRSREQLSFEPSQKGPFGPEVPYLESRWRSAARAAEFLAAGGEDSAFYFLSEESLGAVSLLHFALLEGAGAKKVKVSNTLTFARVMPPPPFKGTATYRAAPDGSETWTGSLTVNLPGASRYPLTGPPFDVSIGFIPALFL
jgi:hypothetical protein